MAAAAAASARSYSGRAEGEGQCVLQGGQFHLQGGLSAGFGFSAAASEVGGEAEMRIGRIRLLSDSALGRGRSGTQVLHA